jgi:tetratricopeptide (TPR) repeat protein
LGRVDEAQRAFQVALEKDGDCVRAHFGLALTYLKTRRWAAAADAALTAVNLEHHHARAHFALGVALLRLKSWDRAIQAIEASVAIEPNFLPGHKRLAQLYARGLDSEKADYHGRRAVELAGLASLGSR